MPDVFKSKRHDTGTRLVIDLTPPAGTTWNLQEAGIAVKLITRLPTANQPKVNAAALVLGAWQVGYDPTALDVDAIGAYDVEVQVTRASGRKVTFPTEGYLSWVIAADLDNA